MTYELRCGQGHEISIEESNLGICNKCDNIAKWTTAKFDITDSKTGETSCLDISGYELIEIIKKDKGRVRDFVSEYFATK